MRRTSAGGLALLMSLVALAGCGRSDAQPSQTASAGGCPATRPPKSVTDSSKGIREELAAHRRWQRSQAVDSEKKTSDDAEVSATISVTKIRRAKSLTDVLPEEMIRSVRRVHVGFPSSNGFYTFTLPVEPAAAAAAADGDPTEELLAYFEQRLEGERAAMEEVANDSAAETTAREIGATMSNVFDAEIEQVKKNGLPIFSVSVADVSGKAAKSTNKSSAALEGAILTMVPQGCDLVDPVYPDEAADSWGAVEDRGRAAPAPSGPAPAPLAP